MPDDGPAAHAAASRLHDALALVEAIAEQSALLSDDERRRLRRAVDTLIGPESPATPRLKVHLDLRWFEIAGERRVSLQRRGPLRLVLRELVERHRQRPGTAATLNELFDAGWAGQRTTPQSGAARVYVALATLRRLGLRPLLQTRDDGYLIDPDAAVEVCGGGS